MNAPVSFGSQQLRLLRRLRRDGVPLEQASERSGCELDTARIVDADDLKNPPPPEAYELLYDPDARAAALTQENDDMARMARETKGDAEAGEGGGIDGEYKRPDAAAAFKIYDEQIKPKEAHLATIKGDMSAPYQAIKDQAHFPRKVLNFIIGLENEEDAKRDHLLFALSEGLKHRQLFLPRDLVTMAAGEEGGDVIPTAEREDEELLVDEGDDADDADLPLAAEPETFTEASTEELSKQEGRGRKRTPAPRPASISSISSPVEARPH